EEQAMGIRAWAVGAFAWGSVPAMAAEQPADPAVEASFAALNPPMQACYDEARAATPGLSGSVTLTLSLAPDGSVPQVAVTAADLRDQDLSLCMMGAARGAHFPPPPPGAASHSHTWAFPTAPARVLVPTAPTYAGVLSRGRVLANSC